MILLEPVRKVLRVSSFLLGFMCITSVIGAEEPFEIDQEAYRNLGYSYEIEGRLYTNWIKPAQGQPLREPYINEYWIVDVTPNSDTYEYVSISLETEVGEILWNTQLFSGNLEIKYSADFKYAIVLRYTADVIEVGIEDRDHSVSYLVDFENRKAYALRYTRHLRDGGFTDKMGIWLHTSEFNSTGELGNQYQITYDSEGNLLVLSPL